MAVSLPTDAGSQARTILHRFLEYDHLIGRDAAGWTVITLALDDWLLERAADVRRRRRAPRRQRDGEPDDDTEADEPPKAINFLSETPNVSLLLPAHRPISQHLSQPQPFRLPSIEDRFHDVGRQASERHEPADIGVRHALLLRKVGDRLGLTALDPAPPPVRADQGL
jgi:hypothetical protein